MVQQAKARGWGTLTEITKNKKNKTLYPTLLLLPNLIGYIRIALIILVIFIAFRHPVLTFIVYFIAGNLDAVDGYLARRLNQESKIGTILDYAVDRAGEVVLFFILATLYPSAWSFFCLLLILDIFSHICQLYSTVFSSQQSHKHIGKQQGGVLGLYYSNRIVLYCACASYDLWLGSLYLYHFFPSTGLYYLSILLLPGFVFKVIVHIMQIISVFRTVSALDELDS